MKKSKLNMKEIEKIADNIGKPDPEAERLAKEQGWKKVRKRK